MNSKKHQNQQPRKKQPHRKNQSLRKEANKNSAPAFKKSTDQKPHGEQSKDTSWNEVAEWYKGVVTSSGSFQENVLLPNILRLLKPYTNEAKVIADIACGTGYFSERLAKQGGHVIGVDAGPQLIAIAKEHGRSLDTAAGMRGTVTYHVAQATSLPIETQSVDAIICVLAIQNIENVREAVSEWARILKPEGTVTIVLNHPSFRIPKGSSWVWNETQQAQYRRIDTYMSESAHEIEMNPGKGGTIKTHSFHRPLQWYSKLFASYQFSIIKIEEWISHKESQNGPRKKEEDRIRKEIPLFMCMQLELRSSV